MGKERMLFDLDDVIVVPNILKIANEITGENKTFDDVKDYFIEEAFNFTGKQEKLFYDALVTRNIYERSEIVKEVYEILKEYSNKYDIFIVSDSVVYKREKYSAKLFAYKYNFIVNNLPFINPRNIVLCGDKSIISGKWFIDDRLENLIKPKNVQYRLMYTAYHNKNITDEELIRNNVVRIKDKAHFKRFIKGNLTENEIRETINKVLRLYYNGKIVYDYCNRGRTGNILVTLKCKDKNINLDIEKDPISYKLKNLLAVDVKCC